MLIFLDLIWDAHYIILFSRKENKYIILFFEKRISRLVAAAKRMADVDMRRSQYQGETLPLPPLPPGISVSTGIR